MIWPTQILCIFITLLALAHVLIPDPEANREEELRNFLYTVLGIAVAWMAGYAFAM